jgi:uncharacterized membrane protein
MLSLSWGFSFWALGKLPARVPIHWDIHNNVNGWGSPLTASMLFPALATVIYMGILAYDWGQIDFKAARAMSPSVARQVRLLVLLLMGVIQVTLLRAVMQGHAPSTSIMVLGISLFLVFLGNVLPRTEPNAWGGIRIPPTLENREVWKRTHRFYGKWLVVTGLLGIPACLLPTAAATLFILPQVLIPTLSAIVYAYWTRNRLDQSPTDQPEPR